MAQPRRSAPIPAARLTPLDLIQDYNKSTRFSRYIENWLFDHYSYEIFKSYLNIEFSTSSRDEIYAIINVKHMTPQVS